MTSLDKVTRELTFENSSQLVLSLLSEVGGGRGAGQTVLPRAVVLELEGVHAGWRRRMLLGRCRKRR